MSSALCLNSSGVTGKSKICATWCTKSFLKLKSKSKKDVSVGWLKVRQTEYETFEKQKIMPHALSIVLGYLVCWSWHAYFKPKDHQIIGRPHGATILDRIMKNETANPTPPPPHKSWMKPCKSQNVPFSHPCLEGRRYKFPIYFVQTSKTTWWNT